MAEEEMNEDYPADIHEYPSAFENSLRVVGGMLKSMKSVSRNELLQKLDPLEQAKVDLVSDYTSNSMFWVSLATQGVNPKEHPVKQELERIILYMNRVKKITEKKKAAKLDKGAASRFVKNALWGPKPKIPVKEQVSLLRWYKKPEVLFIQHKSLRTTELSSIQEKSP
ncbi:nuclear nucleic acid-binding protein C1D-like [Eptesicus fuscus]|uniref:nuclear nucleic acid-binding protein C1D-like n=1 Tax=Eptesicus fuscus TaxID=29078 RepID=UPI0024040AAF|nr:nuclear nucleic acid-binding protein C1D-like [Eptesicus fuscus]